MTTKQPDMSIDFWNLDFLTERPTEGKISFPGSLRPITATPIESITALNTNLQLEIVHRNHVPVLVALDLSKNRLLHTSLMSSSTPNLSPLGDAHHVHTIFSFGETVYGLSPLERAVFEYAKGSYEPTRIEITGSSLPHPCRAILLVPSISPIEALVVVVAPGKEVWTAKLKDLVFERREIRILNVPRIAGNLGRRVVLCADHEKATILISDTENHRVLELNPLNGNAKVLCGTDIPGKAGDGDNPRIAPLNAPVGLAVLRPNTFLVDRLDARSKVILGADSTGILPRTIIIAERANRRLIRLIEMPSFKAGWGKRVPEYAALFGLLGTGEPPDNPNRMFDEIKKKDLRTYRISAPGAIHEIGHGEIFIQMDRGAMVLTPASAEREHKSADRGYRQGAGDT